MRNLGLKIFVVILFLIQSGINFIWFTVLNDLPIAKTINASKGVLLGTMILSLIISLLFVIVILTKIGKTITIIKEVPVIRTDKSEKESKQKKDQEQDKKLAQQLNEKKNQMIGDLTKSLSEKLSLENYSNQALINISRQFDIFQGIFFVRDVNDNVFRKAGTYAYYTQDDLPEFTDGIGLTGQVAVNKKILNISNLPDKYITVLSGLGKSSPSNLLIIPVIVADKTIAIIELASFIKFDSFAEQILDETSRIFGLHISEILKAQVKVES